MTAQPSPATPPALLEAIVEAAPDGILVVDRESRIQMANRQAEALFQYPRDELLGQTIDRLLPERYRSQHLAAVGLYARRAEARPMGTGLSIYALRRDGTEFAADIALSPVTSSGSLYVIASVRDITSRRLLEEEQTHLAERVRRHHEREQVALGLQDSLIQVSYGVGLNLMRAKELVGETSTEAQGVLDESIADLNNLILRVRHLIIDFTGAGD